MSGEQTGGAGARRLLLPAMLVVLAGVLARGLGVEAEVVDDDAPTVTMPWATGAPCECPLSSDDPAARRDLLRQAESFWQRADFDWGDAARAERRLSEAMACARRDGALGELDAHAEQLSSWREVVAHRVDQEALRLELAVRAEDPAQMERHAERLGAVLAWLPGPEAERSRAWLESVRRRARAMRAQERREEEEDG